MNIPPEKLRYLDDMKVKLRGSTENALEWVVAQGLGPRERWFAS